MKTSAKITILLLLLLIGGVILLFGGNRNPQELQISPLQGAEHPIEAPLVVVVGEEVVNAEEISNSLIATPDYVSFEVVQDEGSLVLFSSNPLPFGEVTVEIPTITTASGDSFSDTFFRFTGVEHSEKEEAEEAEEFGEELVERLIEAQQPGIGAIKTTTDDYDIGFRIVEGEPIVHIDLHPVIKPPRSEPDARFAAYDSQRGRALRYIDSLGFASEELTITYDPIFIQEVYGYQP